MDEWIDAIQTWSPGHTDGILANNVSSSKLHNALFIVIVTTPGCNPRAASIANLIK